jgi:hypothetical protein
VAEYPKQSIDSGHIIHARHISEPKQEFIVQFTDPGYLNKGPSEVIAMPGGTRWARVLAESPDKALAVARYHYRRCSDFELKEQQSKIQQRERWIKSHGIEI